MTPPDSSWYGLFTNTYQESVLVLRWDSLWANFKEPRITLNGQNANTSYLLIGLDHLWQMEADFTMRRDVLYEETVGNAASEFITEADKLRLIDEWSSPTPSQLDNRRERMLLSEPLFRTTFSNVYNPGLKLWYSGMTRFLCYTPTGGPLTIPGL